MNRLSALNSVRLNALMLITAIDAENRIPTDGDRTKRTDEIAGQVQAAIKKLEDSQ